MFPAGVPGTALLLLRLSVASSLFIERPAPWDSSPSYWIQAVSIILAVAILIGLMTPYFAFACGAVELRDYWVTSSQNEFHLLLALLHALILAMLGPGAYSFDSRIFGRRLLSLPPRMKSG